MMNRVDEKKEKSIQIMRGISAVAIVLNHFDIFVKRGKGAFGVDIFLIICGYVMMLSTSKSQENSCFLIKRLIRIVPLYWIVTTLIVCILLVKPALFSSTKLEWGNVLFSYLFVPIQNQKPILYVGWTLNYIMIFYILFWVAMKINYKYRGLITSFFLTVLYFIGAFLKVIDLHISILFEFVLGIGLFYIILFCDKRIQVVSASVKVVLKLLTLTILIFMWYGSDVCKVIIGDVDRIIKWGIPALICMLLFYYGCKGDKNNGLKRLFIFLGNISFSIYILHPLIVRGLNKVIDLNFQRIGLSEIIIITLILVAVGLVSWLSYVTIEQKFTTRIRFKILHR